jgi:V/A-type H+-transporting ATPase subunit I
VVLLIAGPSGSLGWLVVIVIGTIFVVAFEGLIVGIQTLRLEYYEFFGRFFRGDGRLFRPLSVSRTEQT